MKAILISTRPEWVIKIITGIKKDEIRKGSSLYKAINKLIEEQGVAPMLIYCTKGKDKRDSLVYVKHLDLILQIRFFLMLVSLSCKLLLIL